MRYFLAAAVVALTAGSALAAPLVGCDDLVDDTTQIANRKIDVGKVTTAARELAGHGVTVRVRVLDTLKGKNNIGELADKIMRECHWTIDGKPQTNLLFIPFAVEKGDISVVTGSVVNKRVSETAATKAIADLMTPRWQVYKHDPSALTNGLVDMLGAFNVAFSQPLTGGGGNTTIIHEAPRQSADLSWLKWLVIGVVVIGGGVALLFLFNRNRDDRGSVVAAQQKARAIFGDMAVRITTISGDKFVSERRFNIDAADGTAPPAEVAQMRADLEKMNGLATSARNALARFLPNQEKDPNPNGLSAAAYQANEQACADMLVNYVEPAEELARKIDAATSAAHTAA